MGGNAGPQTTVSDDTVARIADRDIGAELGAVWEQGVAEGGGRGVRVAPAAAARPDEYGAGPAADRIPRVVVNKRRCAVRGDHVAGPVDGDVAADLHIVGLVIGRGQHGVLLEQTVAAVGPRGSRAIEDKDRAGFVPVPPKV